MNNLVSSRLSLFAMWMTISMNSMSAFSLGQAPGRHIKPQIVKVPMEQEDIPPGYAAYTIPPFSVEFKTINTLGGDPEEDAALLQSEMAKPLKELVGGFIKQGFSAEVATLAHQENSQVGELILDFVSVDFQVNIHHRFTKDVSRRRRRQRQRQLGSIEQDGTWYLDFYAEFIGVAFFVAPEQGSTEQVPSQKYMRNLLLGWMNHHLTNIDDLINSFQNSPVSILNNIQTLEIDTDIVVGGSSPFESDSSYSEDGINDGTMSHGVYIMIVVFLCLSLLVVAATLFRYSVPYVLYHFQDHSIDPTASHLSQDHRRSSTTGPLSSVFPPKELDHHRPKSPRGSNHSGQNQRNNEPLPGRRAGDADEEALIREESDRWLRDNRPDLYEVVKKTSSPNGQTGIDDSASRLSLPMQFLLGGLFSLRRREGEEQQQHSSRGSPRNMGHFSEGNDPEAPFDESYSADRPPAWWTKLLQRLNGSKLACDEDPALYNFPYQDFPRHDGTPCLMYNETPEGLNRVARTDPNASNNDWPFSPTDPLTNDEFKRVLSLNSEENGDRLEEEDEDDVLFVSSASSNKSPEFTGQLERLVEMRLKHFERQNILEKHKSKTERAQDEARQRELKLRRHEMELDMNEIEANYTPRAVTARRTEVSFSTIDAAAASGARSSSNSPVLASSIGTGVGERKVSSHRVTASDSDFHRSGSGNLEFTHRSCSSTLGDIASLMEPPEIGTGLGGNILRRSEAPPRPNAPAKSITSPTPPMRTDPPAVPSNPSPTSVTEKISEPSLASSLVHSPSRILAKSKLSRNRSNSHRRFSSHGVGPIDIEIKKAASVDCCDDGSHRRTTSNDHDVMDFGIAAYHFTS